MVQKKSHFPIIVTVGLVVVLAVGVIEGWWTLSTILNYIPEVILAGIAGAWIWAYRDRIENWFRKETQPHIRITGVSVLKPSDYVKETKPKAPPVKQGIQHYERRSELPFDEMVSKAETKLEISAITFRITTLNNYKTLKGLLSRRVRIIFLLLNPDSASTVEQGKLYHASKDLKEQIQKSLEELCNLKREFKELVDIRLYDSLSEHSILIIDRDEPDKAWIQVELHPILSDSNSRPINTAYRKDNQAFFYQYSKEYDKLLDKSEQYECPHTF
jgi:hypothetical protein